MCKKFQEKRRTVRTAEPENFAFGIPLDQFDLEPGADAPAPFLGLIADHLRKQQQGTDFICIQYLIETFTHNSASFFSFFRRAKRRGNTKIPNVM